MTIQTWVLFENRVIANKRSKTFTTLLRSKKLKKLSACLCWAWPAPRRFWNPWLRRCGSGPWTATCNLEREECVVEISEPKYFFVSLPTASYILFCYKLLVAVEFELRWSAFSALLFAHLKYLVHLTWLGQPFQLLTKMQVGSLFNWAHKMVCEPKLNDWPHHGSKFSKPSEQRWYLCPGIDVQSHRLRAPCLSA